MWSLDNFVNIQVYYDPMLSNEFLLMILDWRNLSICYHIGFLSYISTPSYSMLFSISFHPIWMSLPRGNIISIPMRCGWLSPSPLISISAFQFFSGIYSRHQATTLPTSNALINGILFLCMILHTIVPSVV